MKKPCMMAGQSENTGKKGHTIPLPKTGFGGKMKINACGIDIDLFAESFK